MNTMWFGKLPCIGDFCSWNMPHTLVDELDAWLSSCMSICEKTHSENWLSAYFQTTMCGFFWPAGTCQNLKDQSAFGVLMPSVDKAGRAFPLLLLQTARALSETQATAPFDSWFTQAHLICSQALEQDWAIDHFNAALTTLPQIDETRLNQTTGTQTYWYALDGTHMDKLNIHSQGLPTPTEFAGLFGLGQ
jgi:type VI secretion system protein ImpM